MDESELAFNSGDVIEVTDMRDKNWWWGCRGEVEGWVPAQFVRVRIQVSHHSSFSLSLNVKLRK